MTCEKCNYQDNNEKTINNIKLCPICYHFAPQDKDKFRQYIEEKIDWKQLETFRKYGQKIGQAQKKGMTKKAEQGTIMTRAPLGYSIKNGKLEINEKAQKIRSLFKTFLNKDYSLNSLAKNYGLSVNGLKKILTNRTYLGEIKFSGQLYKGNHPQIISPEIFYAVQRKLREKLK